MLQVGAARSVITPPLGVSLAGSYRDRRATDVHDDLFARALVVDDGAAQIAIVSCDLIGLRASTVSAARRLVEQRCGFAAGHILIAATHNHSGPLTREPTAGPMYGETDEPYLTHLERQIASAVETAFQRRAPAQLHLALGECQGIAFNRRFRIREGPVRTNPGKLNPDILEPAGPVDERVWTLTALPAERESGAASGGPTSVPPHTPPLGMLVNFGLHPAIVAGTVIGADFPHYLESAVQRHLQSDAPVVFANAPCGDVNHVDVSHAQRAGGFPEAARVGTILAGEVVQSACRLAPDLLLTDGPVRAARQLIPLPLRRPTPDQVEWARTAVAGSMSMTPGAGLEVVEAHRILALADHWTSDTRTTEVQVLAIGPDLAVVGLPGEIFAELGLDLRRRSPFAHTIVLGLANEAIGYVPTRRAYDEGGYEPTSSRLAPGGGELLVDAALELLNTLR